MVYIRYASQGTIHTNFVGVSHVERGTGVNIQQAVCSLMDKQFGETWRNKLVDLEVDGAAVNTGKQSRFIALVKTGLDHPFIQGIHCSAHRLELTIKDVVKAVPMLQKVHQFLLNMFYYYFKSPLNRANLKKAYGALGIQSHLMPTRVGGTRWVPHTRTALENLLTGYPAFVQHLSQVVSVLGCQCGVTVQMLVNKTF